MIELNKVLVVLAVLCASLFSRAAQVTVIEPVSKVLAPTDVVDLGIVGPGQKVEVVVDRGTGQLNRLNKEATWDRLFVSQETLPRGWGKQDSLLYESPMKAIVTIDPQAPEEVNYFDLTAWDEYGYEGVLNATFKAKVTVSRGVLDVSLPQSTIYAGTGVPVIFAITVSNRGSASDAFEISSDGIPGEWKYKKKVLVQKHSSETVYYEIMAKEAGNYKVKFDVKSLSSDLIQKEVTADLVAEPGLKSELQASSHGLVLFPNPMQAVYSLVGFLANLVK